MLDAAMRLAPPGTESIHLDIGLLPHFNPDLDTESPPLEVSAFREALRTSDAVIFSTPEYVHSLPGALKDALDWLVSSAELYEKPVSLLNASPNGGQRGQEALRYTLGIMMANVVDEASLTEPFVPGRMDTEDLLADPGLRTKLQLGVEALLAAASKPVD